jgi:hypothetical protein
MTTGVVVRRGLTTSTPYHPTGYVVTWWLTWRPESNLDLVQLKASHIQSEGQLDFDFHMTMFF